MELVKLSPEQLANIKEMEENFDTFAMSGAPHGFHASVPIDTSPFMEVGIYEFQNDQMETYPLEKQWGIPIFHGLIGYREGHQKMNLDRYFSINVDTGTAYSMISPNIVEQYNLKPYKTVKVNAPEGGLIEGSAYALYIQINGNWFYTVFGAFTNPSYNFDVLLGTTFFTKLKAQLKFDFDAGQFGMQFPDIRTK